MLPLLRHCWAPRAFIVSFKLETDESILIDKVGGLGRGAVLGCGRNTVAPQQGQHSGPAAAGVGVRVGVGGVS
jgi:hypothetical protein